LLAGLTAASTAGWAASALASQPNLDQLGQLSIEQLANVQVTSVAKTPEPVSQAPAAVYVITHDAIIRSGAASLPEILRLAPNLQVFQTSASSYVITARGMNGNSAAQSFSDKLLVLIDGRSVYTPLYSGVYWDAQDVPPEDIERIEVISGPGATLWGANAVNGVINIITRKAADTQGGLVAAGGGNLQQSYALQYGGRLGADIAWRAYAKTFWDSDTRTAQGARGDDHWTRPQAGFRVDWAQSEHDSVTVQGDGYAGSHAQAGADDERISGGNVAGSWRHAWVDGSALQAQAYVDRTDRATLGGGGHFWLNTYDVDLQHSFDLADVNQIVWGGGFRINRYRITSNGSLLFLPPSRSLDLADLFVQDAVTLPRSVTLTGGVKLEDDPYAGMQVLPSARLAWRPSDQTLLWTAVSRAIRSPTPFDRDVVEKIGSVVFLTGGDNFKPEAVTAYESGLRAAPFSRLSLSVSTYYNVYDDLRSVEPAPGGFIPLSWGNGIHGQTWGVEMWGDYQLLAWWRLAASFDLMREHLGFVAGDLGLLGVAQAGDDPQHQASLRSSMTLGRQVTLDADLRYVDALPDPHVPAYTELNARLGWAVTRRIELSLSGANLLHPYHQEYPAPAMAVARSVFGQIRWRF
jgi:iron complex outermembrane receptor protein